MTSVGDGVRASSPLPILSDLFGQLPPQTFNVVRWAFPAAAYLLWKNGHVKTAAALATYSAVVAWLPVVGINIAGMTAATPTAAGLAPAAADLVVHKNARTGSTFIYGAPGYLDWEAQQGSDTIVSSTNGFKG